MMLILNLKYEYTLSEEEIKFDHPSASFDFAPFSTDFQIHTRLPACSYALQCTLKFMQINLNAAIAQNVLV